MRHNKNDYVALKLINSNPVEFISSEITTTSFWSNIQEKAKIYFTE